MFHTANVSRHSVHEMWMYACIRVVASELISHDKLILREAPIAAQSECHLCFHGSALSSLCAEPDNGGRAGRKKERKKNLSTLPQSVWQFHGRAQFVERFHPRGSSQKSATCEIQKQKRGILVVSRNNIVSVVMWVIMQVGQHYSNVVGVRQKHQFLKN